MVGIRTDAALGRLALVILVVTTAAAVPLGAVAHASMQLPLLVVALAAFGAVMVCHRRSSFLSLRLVVGVSAALMLLAVVIPPSSSKDVWAHAMYGRIVSVHHASPYVHVPADYPNDPALARMAPAWRHTPSVYGPAFTAVSAAGTKVAGDSPLAQRLFFQALAAVAVMVALLLLARSGADPGALAFVGLNPVVVMVVVGGHNDLLVGLALLAAVLASRRGRAALVGVLLGAAVLVKVSAFLPAAAVVAWMFVRHGRRAGVGTAAAAGAVTAAGYALAGGTAALSPLSEASMWHSKASLWTFPVSWVERTVIGIHPTPSHMLATIAVGAVVVVAAIVVGARVRDVDPAIAAGGAGVVYLLLAAYVLPWYAGWIIPVLALAWRSRVALVAQLQASVLALIYVDRPGVHSVVLHDVVGTIATHVVPVLEAALLIALIVVSARRLATRVLSLA